MSLDMEALKHWTGTGLIWTPHPSSMSWMEIGAIHLILQEFKIRSMFEIGTHRGGLSSLMYLQARFGHLRYSGIEIDPHTADTSIYNESFQRFNLRIGDVFDNIEWVTSCLTPSPALLFCDGGDKQKEVNTFAPLIHSSDFLLAHDYLVEWDELPDHYYRINRWYLENTTLILLSRLFL